MCSAKHSRLRMLESEHASNSCVSLPSMWWWVSAGSRAQRSDSASKGARSRLRCLHPPMSPSRVSPRPFLIMSCPNSWARCGVNFVDEKGLL